MRLKHLHAIYKVTFEGESLTTEDDKSANFASVDIKVNIPEDFMPKMFEYLESDFPYDVLYQIKSITKDQSSLNEKNYVSIIAEYNDNTKGGLLLEDQDSALILVGSWDTNDIAKLADDLYSKPQEFKFVVVTIAESMAPPKNL